MNARASLLFLFDVDKLRLLTAVKQVWDGRVTTVFPQQGHYAHNPSALKAYPQPDKTISVIGDLLDYAIETFHLP